MAKDPEQVRNLKMRTAVFPGSFDPITNGHMDVLKRALKLFDSVIIGVGVNSGKSYMFSPEERVAMIRKATEGMDVEGPLPSGKRPYERSAS